MTNKINIDKKYIRSQIVDNQLYYCAKDLCDYLKLKNVTDFSNFIEDKKFLKAKTNGGIQTLIFLGKEGTKEALLRTHKLVDNQLLKVLDIRLSIKFHKKEISYIRIIIEAFKNLEYQLQYHYDCYFIDLYFTHQKIAIECDEFGHYGRDLDKELERQNYLIKNLGCTFIRFNPDHNDFNVGKVIFEISKIIKT